MRAGVQPASTANEPTPPARTQHVHRRAPLPVGELLNIAADATRGFAGLARVFAANRVCYILAPMAWAFFGGWRSRHNQLPTDKVTRIPRRAKKAATVATAGMRAALNKIGALPGLPDVAQTKRLPRGFYELVDEFLQQADAYHAAVREQLPLRTDDVKRPGEPGGTAACCTAPMGVSSIEALRIYRQIRPWRDFQAVAQRLGELGDQQFKDIQSGHKGKNPEKIRMGSRAVREGRLAYARRMQPCPLLDVEKGRCRIWDQRPLCCRAHHLLSDPEGAQPDHEGYPGAVEAKNLRLPLKVQVALQQLDKRMMLQLSPFMFAGVLQLVQLAQGQLLQEAGEAPQKMQRDGQVVAKANRNVRHAAKFNKFKKKRKKKK